MALPNVVSFIFCVCGKTQQHGHKCLAHSLTHIPREISRLTLSTQVTKVQLHENSIPHQKSSSSSSSSSLLIAVCVVIKNNTREASKRENKNARRSHKSLCARAHVTASEALSLSSVFSSIWQTGTRLCGGALPLTDFSSLSPLLFGFLCFKISDLNEIVYKMLSSTCRCSSLLESDFAHSLFLVHSAHICCMYSFN